MKVKVHSGPGRPALEGVRVLQLADGIAGSIASMLLADAGADVVRLLPASWSPITDEPGAVAWDRGKRCVQFDGDVDALLRQADVSIVDTDRAGFDVQVLSRRHPHLVVADLPAFVAATPWAGGRSSAALVHAMSGLAWQQARRTSSPAPTDLVDPHALYAQGLIAAGAIAAALIDHANAASGRGRVITVGGLDGALVLSTALSEVAADGDEPDLGHGTPCEILQTHHRALLPDPFLGSYRCRGEQWLTLIAPTVEQKRTVVTALHIEHILEDERVADDLSRECVTRDGVRQWLKEELAVACAAVDAREVAESLASAGCPAAPVLDRRQWCAHPQVAAIGAITRVDDAVRGTATIPTAPFQMSRTRVRATTARAVAARATTTSDIGWPPRRRSSELDPAASVDVGRGPLAGIRVLNLGQFVAAPLAAKILGEFGAEVVKVEPITGDPVRSRSPKVFHVNRGARSVALDLRDAGARAAVRALVAQSDILVTNFRPGALRRLGLHLEEVRQSQPGLLTAAVSGFGDTGPLGGHPAYDRGLTSYGGIQRAQGGEGDPVELAAFVLDVAAGLTLVFAVCAGLFARRRDGLGQHVSTSLVHASLLMQTGEVVDYAGRPPVPMGGPDFAGPGRLDRFVEVDDGWVRVQARTPAEEVAAARLVDRLATQTRAEAVAALLAAGVPAAPVLETRELLDRDDVREAELFERDVDDGRTRFRVRRVARFSDMAPTAVSTTPRLGEHTATVLTDAGMPADVIRDLCDRGVALVS